VTARVALDANLLLLLIVGESSKDWIAGHKRLGQYDPAAFDFLTQAIGGASKIVTTPNVLTEVSNLLVQGVAEPRRSVLRQGYSGFLTSASCEIYHPSSIAAVDPEFSRLGLADCVWLGCMDDETVLLTDDLELYLAAVSRGLIAFNFTRLRIEAGLLPT
jgi:hypothetical protein